MSVPAGYKVTEVGVIPNDWVAGQLGSIASFRTGPFGSSIHKSDYRDGGVPLINPMHIVNGAIIPSAGISVGPDDAKRLAPFQLNKGDVIIGRRGEMGRCAYVSIRYAGWLCGTGSMIVRPNEQGEGRYIQRVLSSPNIIKAILETSVGMTMINLNQLVLAKLWIAIPDRREQTALAEALSDMDEAIAAQEAVIAKKRALKTAIMQALLSGTRRLPGYSREWSILQLDRIGRFSKGSGLPKGELSAYGSLAAIPYTAIYTDFEGIIERHQIKNFTFSSMRTAVINSPRLLIAGSSNMLENVGKAVAYTDSDRVAVGGDVLIFETDHDVGFLAYLLSTRQHRQRIVSLAQGSTIRHVYPSTFVDYQVLLPERDEQEAITATIKVYLDEIRVQEARLAKLRLLRSGMMQQLLTGKIRLV